MRVSVIGATGYAGKNLVKLLVNHPVATIKVLTSNQYIGKSYESCFGEFRGYDLPVLSAHEHVFEVLEELDVVFLALPHGITMDYVKRLRTSGKLVIDLSGDYRLTKEEYDLWYQVDHIDEEGLEEAVYGLSEAFGESIEGCRLISNPGCYPTASLLSLMPLVKEGLIELGSIVIDAKSGVSGAGRTLRTDLLYCEVNESFRAYAPGTHRHTPEIERYLSDIAGEPVIVQFTPHLIPVHSGLLVSAYATLKKGVDGKNVENAFHQFYSEKLFIRIIEGLPETRWVVGTNFADIGFSVDKRTGRVLVFCAIDNTIKGAAGQAVQNMNLSLGLEETMGLK
ncbi:MULTISPECIES: N-acetyl-gamma-glutamyl-phosphate reductase [unclassified Fusibacter]|uniref:N-acetyl-gamma-glutamyl-phosphate reductase n=1 Tax=unclassified Fusibacter TaxID=2624464 RepID=UPI0010102AFE|nr:MULTISPECIES: N-acetyl-gamma-glutamyl-phosphate reductase [unclassified Fusibacter]MCK8059505.1 N-acetyl-gamma-glutamyl-phosphate reductase [Fusibacter sp. A2]NPE21031.1 N-acetyl-gamma-glutamyl-phosphate reductase [Fusibacter sp. A1]RXV62305.1 N-acetyl-gamma-glutamyl-phosphate reductase [Fusibacter sp. A1]